MKNGEEDPKGHSGNGHTYCEHLLDYTATCEDTYLWKCKMGRILALWSYQTELPRKTYIGSPYHGV